MVFMDIVRPKYKNSNPEVRKEAIRELKNDKKLMNIMQNDSDKSVREEAVRNIREEKNLHMIVNDLNFDLDVRLAAIDCIGDSDFLLDIVKTRFWNTEVKSRAVNNPHIDKNSMEEVLMDIAGDDYDFSIRKWAIEYLVDTLHVDENRFEEILIDIAKNNPDFLKREWAIDYISDIPTLKDIAAHDSKKWTSTVYSTNEYDEDSVTVKYPVREKAKERISKIRQGI